MCEFAQKSGKLREFFANFELNLANLTFFAMI